MRKVEVSKANGWKVGRNQLPTSRLQALEASPEFVSGLQWYVDARHAMRRLADRYNVPVFAVAGIVAVLSPRQSVSGNLTLAKRVLSRSPIVGGFRPNARKALAILAEPHKVEEHVKGPKVRAFFDALVGRDVLVLDSWAIRAAIGRDDARGRAREAVARTYRNRAKKLGLSLSEYQAGVWVAMRSQSGFRNAPLMSAFVEAD